MVIRIGKASDNDFVVDNEFVSRHHARLTKNDDEFWILEDLESANGTFVNGVRIMKKRVKPTDKITLGGNLSLDFNELLKAGNDYTKEFEALKDVYDNYIKEKIRIQSSNQFKTRLFQALPFAIPGIIGVLLGFLGKGSTEWFTVSLLVTICAPVIGIYMGARQSARVPKELQELTNRFKIEYVCPKCGVFLGEVPWESLKNRKHCPVSTCRAKWSD